MPAFTPFSPRRQFLPRQAFYPNFAPFAVVCALRFPRFYPEGKTAHFFTSDFSFLVAITMCLAYTAMVLRLPS